MVRAPAFRSRGLPFKFRRMSAVAIFEYADLLDPICPLQNRVSTEFGKITSKIVIVSIGSRTVCGHRDLSSNSALG